MGVPKFFRYTSERYPCLNELVKQYQIPDFDNMYLDMNGIIHNCSHPDDSNPHFRITEEKIFQDIFHYISILFQIIKPKKLFFMAIDGVAPRAKMNQQRGRRFRSAREAEKIEEDARAKGETLPTEKRFDSNCITPGTVFMARLHEQLKFFVKEKMSTDPLWSKVKVILSGHETPGEGEHKIMDYIRWARSQPEYDPNTRHCLYGLDADLIMLGMCTHEPHFALLREEVKFGRTTQRATSPEETHFFLLHLALLKEYLEQEFISMKDKLSFPYDIEKIVDDWVLMGFLVGNDFIPHLPHMHIGNDALPLLYKTYMTVLPTLSGYINEAGELNLERFEIFMQELAKIDKEKFHDTYADLKYFEAKTGRRPNALERKEYKPNNDETFNVNVNDIKANKPDDDLQALINATEEMFIDDVDGFCDEDYEETSDEEANIEMEFKLHKRDYYINKLDYSSVTEEVLANQAEGYVRAIQWNLYYYYKGCPSWCWYYPHHYAPYMSDIKGFKDLKIEFELGEPFKPFEQLLAVLPAASKHLLPAPFHDLMTDEDSPIVHYYPINFETDLNGKINDWEAVVLIPFIDEVNLLSAMAPCYQRLTEEELKRNTHGPMLVYNWTPESQGIAKAPAFFPPIKECHAMERIVWRQELEVAPENLRRGILPNANKDKLFPGFPTLRHLKYKTTMKKAKVKVFDQPSRNENMIVEIIRNENEETVLEKVAQELLGKVIWVGWPHLTKAKVISVSNEKMRLHHIDKQNNNINGDPIYTTEMNAGNLHKQWISERSTIIEHNMNRLGIELGDVKIIIHAVNHKGYKYIVQENCKMVQEPEYCAVACGYAQQAVVTDVSAYIAIEPGKYSSPQEAYPNGDTVFLLTNGQYYGAQATVVDSECIRSGRIKVAVWSREQPLACARPVVSSYFNTYNAAATCGISTQVLSRITGTVFLVPGMRHNNSTETINKLNLGLNLKFNRKNQEVSGYTRRCKDSNQWMYSRRCVDLVREYAANYPEIFDKMAVTQNNDVFFESDFWPDEVGKNKHNDVLAWLKSQPHSKAMRRECGSDALEPEDMKVLADDLDRQLKDLKDQDKKVTLQVKWNLLYKPELHEGNVQPDPTADFRLYDRVVCVARHCTVPRGLAGTVTAVYPPANTNTVRLADRLNATPSYQVMFDEPFTGAMSEELFETPRHYRMQATHLLNISFGRKLRELANSMNNNMDVFALNYPPTNILRKEDGHNSAFANYSPPVDKKTSPIDKRPQPNITPNNGTDPDHGTHLLKSLLKISENDSEKNKNNQDQNWRVRNEPKPQPQQKPTRIQQQNWRKENALNNVRPQQPNQLEWTNSNFKSQPPVPPFPTFVPAVSVPYPTFGYRGAGAAGGAGPTGAPPPAPAPHFPSHLPHVTHNNVMLGPSWMTPQNNKPAAAVPFPNNNKPTNPGGDKVNNPFVPLQVQTSQRRMQNSSGSSTRRASNDIVVPKCVMPNPQPTDVPTPQQPQSKTSKQVKKKRPRIAANLPFQMD